MTEERRFAILFAATILAARRLINSHLLVSTVIYAGSSAITSSPPFSPKRLAAAHLGGPMLSVRPLFRLLVLVCFTFLITSFAAAQDPTQITDGINVGLPENGVFDGSDFDTIQVTNGKLHVEVPLYS